MILCDVLIPTLRGRGRGTPRTPTALTHKRATTSRETTTQTSTKDKDIKEYYTNPSGTTAVRTSLYWSRSFIPTLRGRGARDKDEYKVRKELHRNRVNTRSLVTNTVSRRREGDACG